MKIPKKVREEAALICALTASLWVGDDVNATTWTTGRMIGAPVRSQRLANAAWDITRGNRYGFVEVHMDIACVYAEAEALIRTGWSPGDVP